MSSTEYTIKNSTHILFEILSDLRKYDGILFYSLFQLPENKKIRINLYKKIIKKNKQIHFAVENLFIKKNKDIEKIEETFLLNQINYKINDTKTQIGKEKKYVSFRHLKTKRNYLERMNNDKVKCMKISKKYGKEYWDGNRKYGYGGYKYIPGYYTYLAKKLIKDYSLNKESKILDIGCGKGFLIFELSKLLKSKNIYGCDISKYAIKNSKKEVKKNIFYHDARKKFKFKTSEFDFVFSNTTLHNFKLPDLFNSLKEIERIAKKKYICVESYRNNQEQFGVQCWALTAETIMDKKAWIWLFKMANFSGDYEFIYFK